MALTSRSIFIFCIVQVFLICLASIVLQFVAIHRMDDSHHSNIILTSSQTNVDVAPRQVSPAVAAASTTKPRIAYVVTLTGCGDNKRYTREAAMGLITQGAAVLRHSIHLAHSQSNKYDYQMYALIHPAAKECSSAMAKLNYTTLIRNTPFEAEDIQKKFLREHVDGASCCGRKEYIKLYAYTLVQHPVAVVLDLDSLVLQPLDSLFDALMHSSISSGVPIHDGKNATTRQNLSKTKVEAFYTKDYNMVNSGGEKYAGVQGGFLMVKPSESVFEEYVDIVLEGDYREGQGWGGKYGYFFGGMQIQGICAYYYGEKHPELGIELDRCKINTMVDNPYFSANDKKKPNQCRDGRSNCEDCRSTDISDVLSSHFTICQKPWECISHWDGNSEKLCSKLHSEWFRIRRSFEESRVDELRQLPDLDSGAYKPENYFGYCKEPGKRGYLPIQV